MSSERSDSELIDHDRRQLLASAAMGLAAAGVAGMLPLHSAAAATGDAVRPAAKRAKGEEARTVPGDATGRIAAMAAAQREFRRRR